MALTFLPQELIELICGLCETSDLKSLRSTHSKLCFVTEKWLYREVSLFMHRKSLSILKNISESSRLAKHVQSLWIHGDHRDALNFEDFQERWIADCRSNRFETVNSSEKVVRRRQALEEGKEYMTKKEYWKQRRANQRIFKEELEAMPLTELPLSKLQEHHGHHQRLAQEGNDMEIDSSIRKTLILLFRACPSLSSVEFSLARKAIFFTIDLNRRFSRAEENEEFHKGLLDPLGQPDELTCGIKILQQVLLAAADSEYSPKTLTITSAANFLQSFTALQARLPVVVRNLQHFDWQLPDNYWLQDIPNFESIAKSFETGCLFAFIEHAANLRTLNIAFPHEAYSNSRLLPRLSAVIGCVTWPMLTSFKINMVNTSAHELSDFFIRHSASLQEIFLNNIFLEEGRWIDCLEMFAGRLPRLTQFEVTGMLVDRHSNPWRWFAGPEMEDSYGQALFEYVITGEGNVPQPPLDDDIAGFCIRNSPWINI